MVADARKAWQKEIQKRIDDALAEEASSFLPRHNPGSLGIGMRL
jgi:hypothetical protein